MEKTLLLMRHAKSSWAESSQDDFDRPLNERGIGAMEIMGPEVSIRMTPPSRVLCSSAQRARQTLAFILPHMEEDLVVHLEKRLYLASSMELLSAIRQTPEEISTLVMIGHNPGMQDLALKLAGKGGTDVSLKMRMKFPTAAAALFFIPAATPWGALGSEEINPAAFLTPKDLTP